MQTSQTNEIELTATQVLRCLTLAPVLGSDPLAEAAAGAQLLEADRVACAS